VVLVTSGQNKLAKKTPLYPLFKIILSGPRLLQQSAVKHHPLHSAVVSFSDEEG